MSFPSLQNRSAPCKMAALSLSLVWIFGAELPASGAPAPAQTSPAPAQTSPAPASPSASPLAQEGHQIFSSKDGFVFSWKSDGWGVQTKVAEDFGRNGGTHSVEVTVGPDGAAAFTSFLIGGSVKNAIPLDGDLRSHGLVEFYLNGAKDENEAIEQKLQFALTFVDSNGKSVRSPYLPMAQVSDSSKLDSDPATWQLVTINMADLLERMPDPDMMKSLQGVIVQFLGVPNTVYFTDCSVKLEK